MQSFLSLHVNLVRPTTQLKINPEVSASFHFIGRFRSGGAGVGRFGTNFPPAFRIPDDSH